MDLNSVLHFALTSASILVAAWSVKKKGHKKDTEHPQHPSDQTLLWLLLYYQTTTHLDRIERKLEELHVSKRKTKR